MSERVKPTDHSVSVLIEALYHCGCPVAGNMTVGDCAETEQCGCSIDAARLKGCMGPDHQSVRLADLAAQQDGAWQPIETAPKDGTSIIASCGDTVFEAEYQILDGGWWLANTDASDYIDNQVWPTHWQPMPSPPKT